MGRPKKMKISKPAKDPEGRTAAPAFQLHAEVQTEQEFQKVVLLHATQLHF
jgi:hypothetical protein